jgi:hypothetical protein
MNKEFDNSEKIEAYLRNDLSPIEKAEFEERIARDPLLQNELTLQQDIIASLQDFRKSELKARLNRIDLTEGQATNVNLLFYFKAAGTLAIVAMLGYGSMWLLNQPNSPEPALTEKPANKKIVDTASLQPKSSLPDNQPSSDKHQISTSAKNESLDKKVSDETEKPLKHTSKLRVIEPIRNVAEPTGSKAIRPENQSEDKQRESPGSVTKRPDSNSEAKQLDTVEKGENPVKNENEQVLGGKISSGSGKGSGGLNITNSNSPYKFHYTNKGNLVLYGDFTKGYKKIELNEQEYLNFDGNFYFIKANQVNITPLIKVTDEGLINKLRKIAEQE